MNHALIFSVSSFSIENVSINRAHGPHRIASFLREHEWDVEVIDFASAWSQSELREFARSRITSSTKFVGFSCFFGYWDDNINEFALWIKKKYPGIKTIYGSHSYPSNKISFVDFYVVGYGEHAILELIKYFSGSGNKITFDPRFFGDKKLISANDTYPAFPMADLSVIHEDRDYIEPWEWLSAEASRGCKFNCKFCNFPILGVKEDHSASIDKFERQMKDAYDRFGVQNIGFLDETFNQDKELLKRLANCINKFPFKLRSHVGIRLDLLLSNRDTWDYLYTIGAFGHFYGVETLNKKSGSAIGKGMDPEKIKEGLLEVRKKFNEKEYYIGHIGMICGLPYETKETFYQGVEWLYNNWKTEAVAFSPLEIPLDDKLLKLSFMSNNYEKFGYRKINNVVNLQRGSSHEGMSGNAEFLLDWENDDMTLNWAVEQCLQVNKKFNLVQSAGVHQWPDYNIIAQNDWKKLKTFKRGDFPSKQIKDFVSRYIRKKLSWGTT